MDPQMLNPLARALRFAQDVRCRWKRAAASHQAQGLIMRRLLVVAGFATVLCAGVCADWVAGAAQAATPVGAAKVTSWDDLVPKDWDPTKRFRDLELGLLDDGDPRVLQMMREMRETWDNAPTNRRLDGATVRLPGYVVPLEEVKGDLREFLLVPYFGACIHTPPPPANQIVHVIVGKGAKGLRMMDAVWASGTLKTRRQDSVMGMSGYAMEGAEIERYMPPTRP